ncbi:hypothetical protein AMECASPLE_008528 [Ameca splendens]|uniref:Uncharacterized protein n=1 Tax=Ameca splendens TaxID=208324 RepID=A0ABV0XZX8_9TELE
MSTPLAASVLSQNTRRLKFIRCRLCSAGLGQISSQALLAAIGLHALSFPSETCPPSSERPLWTPSVRKHRIKVLIRGKDQLIKVTRPTKLTRPGITFLRPTSFTYKLREVPVPDQI